MDFNKLNLVKYSVETTFIIKDEIITILPNNITNIYIEKDYNDSIHPLLSIEISMKEGLYQKIIQNKNDFLVRFKVTRYYPKNDSDYKMNVTLNKDYKLNRVLVDSIFLPIINDITPNFKLDTFKKDIDGRDKNLEETSNESKTMLIPLFNIKNINSAHTIINEIHKDVSLTESIIRILNLSKVNRMLIDTFDNSDIYDQILIPPFRLYDSISYLQKSYGIYTSGYRFFMDFDRSYLIKKDITKSNAVQDNEYRITYINIEQQGSKTADIKGCYNDDTLLQNFINVSTETVTIDDNGSFIKELDGSIDNITSLSQILQGLDYSESSLKFTKNEINTTYNTVLSAHKTKDRAEFLYNNQENSYIESERNFDKNTNQLRLSIYMEEVDLNMLSINKEIRLNFSNYDYKKYFGSYRIETLSCQLVKKEALDSFTSLIKIDLIKIK